MHGWWHTVDGRIIQSLDNFIPRTPPNLQVVFFFQGLRRVGKRNQPPQHDMSRARCLTLTFGDRVSVQSFPQGLNNLSICGRYYVLYSTFASSSPYLTRDKIWHKLAKSRIRYPRFQVCQTNRFGKYSCAPNLLRVRVAKIHLSGYASPVQRNKGEWPGCRKFTASLPETPPKILLSPEPEKNHPSAPRKRRFIFQTFLFVGSRCCFYATIYYLFLVLPDVWTIENTCWTTPRCCILDQTCRPKCSM